LIKVNRGFGATGATSNPIIISDLIKTGRFDKHLTELMEKGSSDEEVAWLMTDNFVRQAQEVFAEVNASTKGNNGYVSFELDPLLEDPACKLTVEQKAAKYVELGRKWAAGHTNRMIKVPGTPGGLAALEQLAADGITLNVTLLFSDRQYKIARDNVWRGAQRRKSLERFKSVYSIFVSRVDVYTKEHVPDLSPAAQGLVGIVNAKRLWKENQEFWKDKKLPLQEEFIFASTGTKDKKDPADKYVSAFAGADIETNPPATNAAIQAMPGKTFTRMIDQFPPQSVLDEIDKKVDFKKLEEVLMDEGTKKFADPFKSLLALIAEKRAALMTAGRR
jgi:transaldolase